MSRAGLALYALVLAGSVAICMTTPVRLENVPVTFMQGAVMFGLWAHLAAGMDA